LISKPDIPGLKIDGMDVLAVLSAITHGRQWILEGNGPLVYEFTTYRYAGHSMSDPGTTYRTRDEIQDMRKTNDPIDRLKARLIEWNVASEEELKEIDKGIRAHVKQEVAEAEEMAEPNPISAVLFEDIYVRGSEPAFLRGRTPDETYYY
jgi:pyruvate dehydrogenase E1 component alpha subunit